MMPCNLGGRLKSNIDKLSASCFWAADPLLGPQKSSDLMTGDSQHADDLCVFCASFVFPEHFQSFSLSRSSTPISCQPHWRHWYQVSQDEKYYAKQMKFDVITSRFTSVSASVSVPTAYVLQLQPDAVCMIEVLAIQESRMLSCYAYVVQRCPEKQVIWDWWKVGEYKHARKAASNSFGRNRFRTTAKNVTKWSNCILQVCCWTLNSAPHGPLGEQSFQIHLKYFAAWAITLCSKKQIIADITHVNIWNLFKTTKLQWHIGHIYIYVYLYTYQTYQWFCVVENFILIQFLHLWSKLIGSLFPRACSRCKTKLWISSCRTAKRGWLSLAFSQRLESEPTSFKNWTKDWRLYKSETLKVPRISEKFPNIPVQLARPPWWYPLPL